METRKSVTGYAMQGFDLSSADEYFEVSDRIREIFESWEGNIPDGMTYDMVLLRSIREVRLRKHRVVIPSRIYDYSRRQRRRINPTPFIC